MDFEWISMHTEVESGKNFGQGNSTPYDMYVARKSDTPGFETDIVGTDGSPERVCIKGMEFVPNFDFDLIRNLTAKDGEEEERVEFIRPSNKFGTNTPWVIRERSEEFRYPCVYSISKRDGELKCYWTNTCEPKTRKEYPSHFGVPKVIFGKSQRAGIPYADHGGKYAMTQFTAAIVDDPANLDLIAKAMHGDRFRRAMETVKFNTEEWNHHVIPFFRKEFWREFVDMDGNLLDENGNVIPEGRDNPDGGR